MASAGGASRTDTWISSADHLSQAISPPELSETIQLCGLSEQEHKASVLCGCHALPGTSLRQRTCVRLTQESDGPAANRLAQPSWQAEDREENAHSLVSSGWDAWTFSPAACLCLNTALGPEDRQGLVSADLYTAHFSLRAGPRLFCLDSDNLLHGHHGAGE